jgi:hypothetical protein
MIQAVEAMIDRNSRVRLLQDILLPRGRRALVTVLEEDADTEVSETALLSESSLATDWLRPEEDEAWSHLELEPWFRSVFQARTWAI